MELIQVGQRERERQVGVQTVERAATIGALSSNQASALSPASALSRLR